MPNTIGTAYIQIEPTTEGISGSISKVLDPEAESAGNSAGNKLSGALGTAAKVGLTSVVALGSAVAGTGAALVEGVSDTAEYGDNIDKMSQKLGVSSTFYQEWDAVLQHSGTSMDSMSATFKKLANASQDASADQEEAFKKLGLSMEEVSSMSTEELFTSVISGLQGMEEGSERTSVATDLLGKGAMELGALLNTSAEDTQGMIDTVHGLGGVMSEDAVKASAGFQDSLQDMKTAIGGAKNNLLTEFLPSVTEVMDGIGKLASGDESGLGLIKEGLDNFVENLNDVLPDIIDVGLSIIESLAGSILDNIDEITDSAMTLMERLLDELIEHLPEIVEFAIKLVVKLATGIIKALPKLVAKMPEVIKAIVDGLAESLPDLLDAGEDIVTGIWNGIKDGWEWLKTKVSGLAGDLVDSVKDFFKIGSPSKLFRDEVGQWIPEGIAVGIDANADSVTDAIDDLSVGTLNASQNLISTSYGGAYSGQTVSNTNSTIDAIYVMLQEYMPNMATNDKLKNLNFNVNGREFARLVNEV